MRMTRAQSIVNTTMMKVRSVTTLTLVTPWCILSRRTRVMLKARLRNVKVQGRKVPPDNADVTAQNRVKGLPAKLEAKVALVAEDINETYYLVRSAVPLVSLW